jgi:hypothetical protein
LRTGRAAHGRTSPMAAALCIAAGAGMFWKLPERRRRWWRAEASRRGGGGHEEGGGVVRSGEMGERVGSGWWAQGFMVCSGSVTAGPARRSGARLSVGDGVARVRACTGCMVHRWEMAVEQTRRARPSVRERAMWWRGCCVERAQRRARGCVGPGGGKHWSGGPRVKVGGICETAAPAHLAFFPSTTAPDFLLLCGLVLSETPNMIRVRQCIFIFSNPQT